jgi:hypothetical protein
VLGALIVFVTFVVKEGLRDRGKDLLASVESAQTTFVMRSDVEDLRLQLRSLQRSIRTTGGESMEVERYNTIAQAQFWVQHGLSASLDNTSRLLQRLPNNQRDTAQLKDFRQRLDKLREAHDAPPADLDNPSHISEQEISRQLKIGSDLGRLSTQVRIFERQVLEQAERLAEKEEQKYNLYTLLSYGFFSLGWGLALMGKIFDVNIRGDPAG